MTARILVVDDQDYNRELIGRILIMKNYEVLYAENASEAIAVATADNPDVILMDIGLPGMDGIEATKILKENVQTTHIPVIAVSAHTNNPDDEDMNRGFYDFISKPIDFSVLISVINSAIHRKTKALGG
jgi:two-component system cell cycle response regulator